MEPGITVLNMLKVNEKHSRTTSMSRSGVFTLALNKFIIFIQSFSCQLEKVFTNWNKLNLVNTDKSEAAVLVHLYQQKENVVPKHQRKSCTININIIKIILINLLKCIKKYCQWSGIDYSWEIRQGQYFEVRWTKQLILYLWTDPHIDQRRNSQSRKIILLWTCLFSCNVILLSLLFLSPIKIFQHASLYCRNL